MGFWIVAFWEEGKWNVGEQIGKEDFRKFCSILSHLVFLFLLFMSSANTLNVFQNFQRWICYLFLFFPQIKVGFKARANWDKLDYTHITFI